MTAASRRPAALAPPPVVRGDPALWHGLRALVEWGYDVATLEQAIGVRPLAVVVSREIAERRSRLDRHPACTTAVELFLLGTSLQHARAARGLAPLGVERLLNAGLLELHGARGDRPR